MQIVLLDEVLPEPWRNGGGTTRPLASGWANAGSEHAALSRDDAAPDWRLSLANIVADGEFSVLPGMDRHALLLGSGEVSLTSSSTEPVCARPLQAIRFAGEPRWYAQREPGSGQTQFLNLMVRRSLVRGELRVIGQACQVGSVAAWALLPLAGRWQVSGDVVVAQGQLAWDRAGPGPHCLPLDDDASAVLVRVHSI
ncbi:HutD family protein [Herbaspirillum sp. NPDC087042]|uniref:HutD/Ves family protein n=1 Tax=Herbaspirillum sp. NPDC087042 TaxID=3364004 RepID=UPI00382B6EDB